MKMYQNVIYVYLQIKKEIRYLSYTMDQKNYKMFTIVLSISDG